jgi:transmembrane 9 superfamily protein 3
MGASTSLYVFLYSIHYFLYKTHMSGECMQACAVAAHIACHSFLLHPSHGIAPPAGFFQMAFYFGYQTMFCVGLGLMCGAVGYMGAAAFTYAIYRTVKCD